MHFKSTLLALLLAACAASAAELPKDLVVDQPPADALSVVEARAKVKPGDAITLRGYVGGRAKPFVDGRAMFVLADPAKVQPCDAAPGDSCPTPWDACCTSRDDIKAGTATIQVAGADGKVVSATLEGVGGVKAGSSVIVIGTVSKLSNDQVLIVDATRLYVQPAAAKQP